MIDVILNSKFTLALAFLIGAASFSSAAIIGTNVPAQPVTAERIAGLPRSQRSDWKKYLALSARQLQADQEAFRKEMKNHGVREVTNAPPAKVFGPVPMKNPAAWYAGTEARRIADIIVSFQTPAGGWSKRLDLTQHERAPGELFTSDNTSRFLTESDNDQPHLGRWSYTGTFDNDATTTQMRYLAKVIAALPSGEAGKCPASFERGLEYILAAQYPNGGWPQVWPLQGGYHDAITYNDYGMIHVVELLRDVAGGRNEFAFVPPKSRRLAAASLKRGVECMLATQVIVDGRRTVWGQQHDALTLKPTSARNYEMPSLSGAESAGIMKFLMVMPDPEPKLVEAVHAAAAWFEKTALYDVAFRTDGTNGRVLMPARGHGPIWPRYSEIGTDRPIFGDRDKSIHDNVGEISTERRRGYSWFNDAPKAVLDDYADWKAMLKAKR
jgi:PelA/Pel-15E family pectate lyase